MNISKWNYDVSLLWHWVTPLAHASSCFHLFLCKWLENSLDGENARLALTLSFKVPTSSVGCEWTCVSLVEKMRLHHCEPSDFSYLDRNEFLIRKKKLSKATKAKSTVKSDSFFIFRLEYSNYCSLLFSHTINWYSCGACTALPSSYERSFMPRFLEHPGKFSCRFTLSSWFASHVN